MTQKINNKFKKTEIGEIPKDWEVKEFNEVANYYLGRTPPRKEKKYWTSDKGYPWVSISDMKPFSKITKTAEMISKEATNIMPNSIVPKGTLLMSFKLTVGRTSILDIDAYHNEAIISIFPKDIVSKEFLFYYLPTINYSVFQDRAVKGQTLNKSKIDKLPIILPPKSEQEKIASFLSRIQGLVENQEKLIERLKELKSSTMSKLFTDGIYNKKRKKTDIGEIPEDWEVKQFSEAVSDDMLETKESEPKSFYKSEGKYPVIDQGKELISGYTNDDKKAYKDCLPIIIFGDHTRVFKFIDFPFVTGADGVKLIKANENVFIPKFLYYTLTNLNIPNRGYNRHFKILKEQILPCPPKSEQDKIAEILNRISKEEEIAQKKLEQYKELFSAMLNQLMTGKIRLV